MKRFLTILLIVMCLVPMCVFAKEKAKKTTTTNDNKVKVYVFEAGGCPYCEMQIEYLKGLKSYNKKFVIVSKELFVDHVDWEEGKDYELGNKVAIEFTNAGFEQAQATGTPFVIISDLYAVNGYSDKLESIIDKAYEEGDRDAVSCIAAGKDDCVRWDEEALKKKEEKEKANQTNGGAAILIIGGVALLGAVCYIVMSKKKSSDDSEDEFDEEIDEEVKEEKPVKKAPAKKAPAKKTTNKKSTAKKPTKK